MSLVRKLCLGLAAVTSAALTSAALAAGRAGERMPVGSFSIDQTEVTIGQFARFAEATRLITRAETEGGGFEYVGGWVRRPGWTYRTPSGERASLESPAVHITHGEAAAYCAHVGGRLPSASEWRLAAYTETRSQPIDGYSTGRTYRYPVGDMPDGMNLSGQDPWPRHAPVGTTRRGVNGLFDMGGNVWEWLADRRGDDALTAGGSWWYGAGQTMSDALQWKPAAFYAVYVGFRCVYPQAR